MDSSFGLDGGSGALNSDTSAAFKKLTPQDLQELQQLIQNEAQKRQVQSSMSPSRAPAFPSPSFVPFAFSFFSLEAFGQVTRIFSPACLSVLLPSNSVHISLLQTS